MNLQKIQNNYKDFCIAIFSLFYKKNLRGLDGYAGELIEQLQDLADKKVKKLMINMPPRFGKTQLAYICFVAWCIGRNPKAQFLCISMTHSLAKEILGQAFDLIDSPIFKEIFPHCKISKSHRAKSDFKTTQFGSVRAFGAGGSITGKGAGTTDELFGGCIIVDDIIKPEKTLGVELQKRNLWYYQTLFSRRNTDDTPIMIIGQRLHQEDIFGFLIEKEGHNEWKQMIIRALNREGKSICPEVMPDKELHNLRRADPITFHFQYQQETNYQFDDCIFKISCIKYLNEDPKPLLSFVTTDFAMTEKSSADNSVFGLFYLFQAENNVFSIFLKKIFINKLSPSLVVDAFMDFIVDIWKEESIKPSYVYFENVSSTTIYRDFIEQKRKDHPHISYVTGIAERSTSKIERFMQVQYPFSTFNLYLPAGCPTNQAVIDELKAIRPSLKKTKDDIADVITDAFIYTYRENGIRDNFIKGRIQESKKAFFFHQ
jgi:hypothetical protein